MNRTSIRRIRPRFIAPLLVVLAASIGGCAPAGDEPDLEPSDTDDEALTMSGTLAATRIVWSGSRGEEIRFTLQTQTEDVPLKLAATVTDMRGLPKRMRPGMQVSLRGRMEAGSLIVDTVEAATDGAAPPVSGSVLHTPALFEEDRQAPPWTDPFEIGDLAEGAVQHVNEKVALGQLSLESVGAFPQGLGPTLQGGYLGRSKACDLEAILSA
ncbi:MAG: hypothetical protein JNK04_17895, partial [Myxococcales bacterium]|nr:hypothetical protein [Myxococcales bacterium]